MGSSFDLRSTLFTILLLFRGNWSHNCLVGLHHKKFLSYNFFPNVFTQGWWRFSFAEKCLCKEDFEQQVQRCGIILNDTSLWWQTVTSKASWFALFYKRTQLKCVCSLISPLGRATKWRGLFFPFSPGSQHDPLWVLHPGNWVTTASVLASMSELNPKCRV